MAAFFEAITRGVVTVIEASTPGSGGDVQVRGSVEGEAPSTLHLGYVHVLD